MSDCDFFVIMSHPLVYLTVVGVFSILMVTVIGLLSRSRDRKKDKETIESLRKLLLDKELILTNAEGSMYLMGLRVRDYETRLSQLSRDRGSNQFTEDELRKLMFLCHPDKHGHSNTATEIAARISQIRSGNV